VLPLTRLARLVKIIFQKLSLEIWYSDMDSQLEDFRKLSSPLSSVNEKKIYHSYRFSGGFLTYH
jgi:hypothetical protein